MKYLLILSDRILDFHDPDISTNDIYEFLQLAALSL